MLYDENGEGLKVYVCRHFGPMWCSTIAWAIGGWARPLSAQWVELALPWDPNIESHGWGEW